MNAIETKSLSKRFGVKKAVDDLNIIVPSGTVCGFLGRNGAGKTTTVKMLAGIAKPTAGTVYIMGKEHKFGSTENNVVGYLPDVPNFYGYMTGVEYLDFCGKLCNITGNVRKDRIGSLLRQVGLENVKTRISGYSRGMKQRLGIAQALMGNPEIIVMDEPISALDPAGRYEIMELIRSLRKTVTIFFSTHILADVENICDYIIIIDKGKVLMAGELSEIKQQYVKRNSVEINLVTSGDKNKLMDMLGSQTVITAEDIADNRLRLTCIPSLEDIFMEVIT